MARSDDRTGPTLRRTVRELQPFTLAAMASMVHLTRHGEVENPKHLVYANLPGFGLSTLGNLQAKEAGRFLASRPVVAVWSSPLQRAIETAHFIAARHQLPVHVDERLTEWHLSSRWSGIRWEDLPQRLPGELEAYLTHPWDLDFTPESLEELADRVAEVATELSARYLNGDVVMVGHQDPIHAARLRLTGADHRRQQEGKPGHAAVVSLRPDTPWREMSIWEPESASTPPSA